MHLPTHWGVSHSGGCKNKYYITKFIVMHPPVLPTARTHAPLYDRCASEPERARARDASLKHRHKEKATRMRHRLTFWDSLVRLSGEMLMSRSRVCLCSSIRFAQPHSKGRPPLIRGKQPKRIWSVPNPARRCDRQQTQKCFSSIQKYVGRASGCCCRFMSIPALSDATRPSAAAHTCGRLSPSHCTSMVKTLGQGSRGSKP